MRHNSRCLPERDEQLMGEALREARAAFDEEEIPIGAVIAYGGNVVSRGHNMTERLHDATAHAEMIAMTAATELFGGKFLHHCTLYVTVEPCPMCAGGLFWSRIGRVVYGASDLKRGYTLFSPGLLHPQTAVVGGVRAEECAALMKKFFAARR